jgi:hypothetical protein
VDERHLDFAEGDGFDFHFFKCFNRQGH